MTSARARGPSRHRRFLYFHRKNIFFRMALFVGCLLLSQMEALGSASTKRKRSKRHASKKQPIITAKSSCEAAFGLRLDFYSQRAGGKRPDPCRPVVPAFPRSCVDGSGRPVVSNGILCGGPDHGGQRTEYPLWCGGGSSGQCVHRGWRQ